MIKDNSPAFPIKGHALGLTKREYFIAKAMQALLSNPGWMKVYKGESYLMQSEILADVAIKTADVTLAKLLVEEEETNKEHTTTRYIILVSSPIVNVYSNYTILTMFEEKLEFLTKELAIEWGTNNIDGNIRWEVASFNRQSK